MPFANLGGWEFLIILVVILLLFGALKLPGLAKSIGQSMKILKNEVRGDSDESTSKKSEKKSADDSTPST